MKPKEKLEILVDPKTKYEEESLIEAIVYANIDNDSNMTLKQQEKALEYYQQKKQLYKNMVM